MSEPDDALPSAPPAEEVLSPLEYAELYSMATCTEVDVEQGLKRTKKALKLKAYARRLKVAVQQRVEKEVEDARSQRWTWKSPGANADLEKQLQDLQGLIDDVSSVASVEDGVWRYKKVWEPKLEFIQEDIDRGVPENVIASKYDIFDAAGEAIQYQQSMKLLREIGDELKQTESILTQTQAENESESLRLLSFFDILQGRIDSAMKLEAKASKLSLQAKDYEVAMESVRSAVSGLEACLDNSVELEGARESHQPFLAKAQESAARLSQHAKDARKDFEMIQKSNREATEFLNSQLRAYEEAQRSCGLLSGTLQDLQQAMLEHKEEPPLPSVLESKRELLSNMRVSLQRCIFKARGIEAFEMEERLKRCETESDLAAALDLARRIKDVDPVLVEERKQLLTRLTEKRIAEERRKEASDQRVQRMRQRCRSMREKCDIICRTVCVVLSVILPVTVGTLAGIQLNVHWLKHPPPLDSNEVWVGFCKAELCLTGVAFFLLVAAICMFSKAVEQSSVCGCSCVCCFVIIGFTFVVGLFPGVDSWSSEASSWMRIASVSVYLTLFPLAWLSSAKTWLIWCHGSPHFHRTVAIVLVILLIAGAIACFLLDILMPVWSVVIPVPTMVFIVTRLR